VIQAPPAATILDGREPSGQRPPVGASSRVAIRCRDVHKFYLAGERSVYALKGISVDVREREFVSIVGKSGCGKSTLLHCIAGLLPVSHGEIAIDGEQVLKPGRRDIGLPAEMFGLPRQQVEARARQLLKLVEMDGFEQQYPNQLSGGMQQRIAIARALVHDPSVLLMDEPFGALDAQTRETMNLELMRIWEATPKTVVFVTHDLQEAAFLSNRVIVMSARPGTIQEIVDVPLSHPRDRDMLYSPEFVATVKRLRELLSAQREGSRDGA
jgi:NitT/TauT family transport system ATP-binding protein